MFTLLCGAFKALIKDFEAPQRSIKIKISVIFILIQLSEMQRAGRVKNESNLHSLALLAMIRWER